MVTDQMSTIFKTTFFVHSDNKDFKKITRWALKYAISFQDL